MRRSWVLRSAQISRKRCGVISFARRRAKTSYVEVNPSIAQSRRVWFSRVQSYGVNAEGRTRFTFQRWKNSWATSSRKSSYAFFCTKEKRGTISAQLRRCSRPPRALSLRWRMKR